MKRRRLVAALACRAGGSRLYGKPLQALANGHTIIDVILAAMKDSRELDEVVLGISEGSENIVFADVARRHGASYILGPEKDVLWRLILCGRAAAATDVFRITSECPFTAWELLAPAWRQHVKDENDITVVDFLPEGMHFEIYTLAALERSHAKGDDSERSEYCSAFARRRPELFKIRVVEPPQAWRRLDLRLTVDYPEDLVLCRDIYKDLGDRGPRIPTGSIIEWVDAHPERKRLVEPYVHSEPLWAHVAAT